MGDKNMLNEFVAECILYIFMHKKNKSSHESEQIKTNIYGGIPIALLRSFMIEQHGLSKRGAPIKQQIALVLHDLSKSSVLHLDKMKS